MGDPPRCLRGTSDVLSIWSFLKRLRKLSQLALIDDVDALLGGAGAEPRNGRLEQVDVVGAQSQESAVLRNSRSVSRSSTLTCCATPDKVDELERVRDRLLGEAFREYRLKYDSLALGPIEVAVR